MPAPTAEQIDRARQKAEQAKARLQAMEARANQAARKADTRRKIILGGLLLDAAGKDERYAKVVAALMGRIDRDQDRKAFDGWTAPTPGNGAGGAIPAPGEAPVTAEAPGSP